MRRSSTEEKTHLTTFNLTFLIAFSADAKTDSSKKKKKKAKEKPKETVKNEEPYISEDGDHIIYEVHNPLFTGHLEYTLIPNKFSYWIDCVCWKNIAKIYTNDGERSLKTVAEGSVCWISFNIIHVLHLTLEDLNALHAHTVNFMTSMNYNKLGARAKSDKPQKFYITCYDPFSPSDSDFIEVLEGDTEHPPGYQSIRQLIEEGCLLKAQTYKGDEISLVQAGPYKKHWETVKTSMKDSIEQSEMDHMKGSEPLMYTSNDIIKADDTMSSIDDSIVENAKKSEDKKKNDKKKKVSSAGKGSKKGSKKGKSQDSIKFIMYAESFFTGLNEISSYTMNGSPTVPFISAIVSVENLLSPNQKTTLNPITVRIGKIENIPLETLKEHGFSSLYVTYNIANAIFIMSKSKSLEENVVVNDAHAIMTETIEPTQLAQFFQTERLIIEVYGVRDNNIIPTKEKLFGIGECDVSHKHCHHSTYGQTYHCCALMAARKETNKSKVKLAVAAFDLCPLFGGHLVRYKGALVSPRSSYYLYPVSQDNYKPPEDYAAVNLTSVLSDDDHSPLTDQLLYQHDSKIEIVADIASCIQPLLHEILALPNIFTRLFVILKDLQLATKIISEVFTVNRLCMGKILPLTDYQLALSDDYSLAKTYFINLLGPNPVKSSPSGMGSSLRRGTKMSGSFISSENESEDEYLTHTSPVTGFAIDGIDMVMVYVEGTTNSQFKRVWQAVMDIESHQGHVMYNSDLVFNNRLYDPLLVFASGFMVITLKEPLEVTLTNPDIFREGWVPLPACQALKKLQQLLNTKWMRNASQDHLFPTVNELLSLDLEFGIPLHP